MIIGIGNITFGGTGKTIFVMELVKRIKERVCVISRGYGGKREGKISLVSDGTHIFYTSVDVGDEPYMLAKQLYGSIVITAVRREEAITYAKREFGVDIFILDDSFQYRRLKKDINILMFNSDRPFFPPRDIPSRYKTADLGIIVRREWISSLIEKIKIPIYYATIQPETKLEDKKVVAFCGIGRPDSFKYTLKKAGCRVLRFVTFNDHHNYSLKDIRQIKKIKEEVGADKIVTTEKDFVKLSEKEGITPVSIKMIIENDFWEDLSSLHPEIPIVRK